MTTDLKPYTKASIGDVVLSVAVRDKGRVFAVMEVLKSEYVLISDGKSRKSDNMKLKKILHLRQIGKISKFATDNELSESLKAFKDDFSIIKARHYKPKG